jgi:SulP family sulfate permease
LLLRRFRPRWPGALIGLLVASGLVVVLGLDQAGVVVLGELPSGLPVFTRLPIFNLPLIGKLSTGALAVAAMGLIESMSTARSLAAKSGQRLDSNQEFVGRGLANLVSGFFSGYACSGSFTRSNVNYESSGKTQHANVFSGFWVLAAGLLFAPFAVYLPRAALAGVLVVIAYTMIGSAGDAAYMAYFPWR